ncbi:MAG: DUF975 family protein, partial [Clostridia bacterium]|nr:DUF975 family protein [Clostridia bacterium]
MPLSRETIKEIAKLRLRENRSAMIIVALLYAVIGCVLAGLTYGIAAFFLLPPLMVAVKRYYLMCWEDRKPQTGDFFHGCFDFYTNRLCTILLMGLKIFLWSLLFVIPGIVKMYAYLMVPYVTARHPNVTASAALRISERMTEGYRMDLFVAHLSFLGWELLSGVTFGILEIVFVGP